MLRIKKIFLLSLSLQFVCLLAVSQTGVKEESNIASIRLYNPNKSGAPTIVEIPIGNIATSGLVDWQNVQLNYDGEEIPFSIREGQAHWKAALVAPVKKPRAEDLLVFSIRVPSKQWVQVELIAGHSKSNVALAKKGSKLVISYPDMTVVIDEHTGMLTKLEAFGESVLTTPLEVQFFKVGEGVATYHGTMGVGNGLPIIDIKKLENIESPNVKLFSWSSTEALTEINFVLKPMKGPTVGLTYRIYPNHQIEIMSDERPWQGTSPWLDGGLEYKLSLAGSKEMLSGFQTHFPMYGYKDYAASVNSVGTLYHGTKAKTFELGEESLNGRFWHRHLAIYPKTDKAQKNDLLTMLNDGLVVEVIPVRSKPLSRNIQVIYSKEINAVGELVVNNLRNEGIEATTVSRMGSTSKSTILLNIAKDPTALGISGDGFLIQPLSKDKGIEVIAGSTFGLYRGTSYFSELNNTGGDMTVSLISQNPVVDLRAGGFGGGRVEVDFPYENDSVWEHAFSKMITNGMNTMTDLGMWSNWQMPVYFKYMPALQSNSPDEYDPVSGLKFSQIASSRAHGLKLLNFLHARGVKVWLWIPIGAIPTTFEKKFPNAVLSAKSIHFEDNKTPRFLAPEYQQYLKAYFKEILEVYPVDGFVLIRDDNGGVDTTSEFKHYVAQSRTKSPVWEQYLTVYKLLHSMNFKGDISIYPYNDFYETKLDSLLPKDLKIVGHGSGMGVLTRDFNTLGAMGDTWLDNLYSGFRVPASGRMKRLLSDRGSYWIGGAYKGAELPWDAIGYFGWQPSASVNTFRYDFGVRNFGTENALNYVEFSDAYEHLWEIMGIWLLPNKWVLLSDSERTNVAQEGRRWLIAYYQQLNKLEEDGGPKNQKDWFAQVGLYGTYFNYHLRRLEILIAMEEIMESNKRNVEGGHQLSDSLRKQLIDMNAEVYALAYGFDQQVAQVPGKMMASLRANKMTLPFKEQVFGYDGWLEQSESLKQFAGKLNISLMTVKLTQGQPFELQVELQNDGCMPWISGVGQEIELQGDTTLFGLPSKWDYDGDPMVFGDRRIITLHGLAPMHSSSTEIKINFRSPDRGRHTLLSQTIELKVP